MARDITVTFDDDSQHVYQGAPDTVTPTDIEARAQKDFGKKVKALDGGRRAEPAAPVKMETEIPTGAPPRGMQAAMQQPQPDQGAAPPPPQGGLASLIPARPGLPMAAGPSTLTPLGRQIAAPAETALAIGSGATTGFLGGLLNAGNRIAQQIGGIVSGQNAEQIKASGPSVGTAFEQGMQTGTYAPQIPEAQAQTEAIGTAMQTHGPALMGIGPELGALGGILARGARAGGARLAEASAARVKATALAQPELEGIRAAHDAGYKLSPKAARAGAGAQMAESAAGPARLGKELSAHNAENTARLARQDVGLPDDVPATPEATAQIRKDAGQDYAAVQDVGRFENDAQYTKDLDAIVKPFQEGGGDFARLAKNPIINEIEGLRVGGADTGSAISVVKDLRNEADKAFRAGDKNLGNSYRAAASAVDNSMDRALGKMAQEGGDPALTNAVDKYRAARVRIAKTYLLDDAMDGKPGEVNANAYARALDKGAPLSGPGLQIAQFAKQFGEEGLAQKKGKSGGKGPGYGDILLAALHTPVGGAALVARPVARAVLGSEFMQKRMAGTKPARGAMPEAPPETPPTGPAGSPGPETPPAPTDPRLAEIAKLREGATDPAVQAALDAHEKTVQADLKTKAAAAKQAASVDALEAAAKATQDPDLRATLQKQADKLRGEKIPVGEATELAGTPTPKAEKMGKIPVGKVVEGQPALPVEKPGPIPTGAATEITPEVIAPEEPIPVGEATDISPVSNRPKAEVVSNAPKAEPVSNRSQTAEPVSNVPQAEAGAYAHRALFDEAARRGIQVEGRRPSEVRNATQEHIAKEHGLNPMDMERAKNVAQALNIDEKAVEAAAAQHDKSPRAFDRAIDDIIQQGTENAFETKQAANSSEGPAPNPPTGGGQGGAGPGRGGKPNGNPERPSGATGAGRELAGPNRPAATGAHGEGNQPGGQAEAIPVGDVIEGAPETQAANNASGESEASSEAINRAAREKAAGQERVLIDRDGTVRPLIGPGAVDQVARPGQVVAQKGVGAKEWTVLSSGADMTQGAVNRALSKAEGRPEGFEKGAQKAEKSMNVGRHAEIKAELAKLNASYEKKSKSFGAMVPPAIRADALRSITRRMDKLDAELKTLEPKKTGT